MYDEFEDTLSSDDEICDFESLQYSVECGKRKVSTLVVAYGISAIAISHLSNSSASIIKEVKSGKTVGGAFVSENIGFIVLQDDCRLDVSQIFDFEKAIALDSRQSRLNQLVDIRTSDWILSGTGHQLQSGINGVGADVLTQCMISNIPCLVVVNEHASIRVELDGIYNLWSFVRDTLSMKNFNEEIIKQEFRKSVPVNRKVPLYT